MTTTSPTESDPFFDLLTDALRAGPGSEQWEQAVAKLRDGGVEGADEYRLLIRAREDLQQGREFRRVTPGPQFTRKVLEAVEEEGGKRKGLPTATIVAILAAGVILAVIGTVTVLMTRDNGNPKDPRETAIASLDNVTFPVAVTSAQFTDRDAGIPAGWRKFGDLPLTTSRGLRVAGGASATGPSTSPSFVGGGVVTVDPLPPDATAGVDVELATPKNSPRGPVTQIFISDSADFSTVTATTPHELAFVYRDGRASVVDAGGKTQESVALGSPGQSLNLSIRFDRDTAIVDAGGKRLFAAAHGLTPDAPRYVGVRFIRAAGDAGESASVRTINVSRSAPAGGR
jgi:hypothetical protein